MSMPVDAIGPQNAVVFDACFCPCANAASAPAPLRALSPQCLASQPIPSTLTLVSSPGRRAPAMHPFCYSARALLAASKLPVLVYHTSSRCQQDLQAGKRRRLHGALDLHTTTTTTAGW